MTHAARMDIRSSDPSRYERQNEPVSSGSLPDRALAVPLTAARSHSFAYDDRETDGRAAVMRRRNPSLLPRLGPTSIR